MKNPLKTIGKLVWDRRYRNGVLNDNFSIICSNCIGGVIYNHLGRQFLSPTVNLNIKQDDFIRMCCDLRHYMSEDIRFIKTDLGHPVGKIDDITVYFNHDTLESEAAEKWYRRRERINYDNLYFIYYYGDGITEDDALKLENVKCVNKVILSPERLGWQRVDSVSVFKPDGTDSLSMRGMNQDIFGIRSIERKFDFISFLNSRSKEM